MKKILSVLLIFSLSLSFGIFTVNAATDPFSENTNFKIINNYIVGIPYGLPVGALYSKIKKPFDFDVTLKSKKVSNDNIVTSNMKIETSGGTASKTLAVTGDVDLNGTVNVTDLVKLTDDVVHSISSKGLLLSVKDLDNNGKLNVTDVLTLAQSIVKTNKDGIIMFLSGTKTNFNGISLANSQDIIKTQGRCYTVSDGIATCFIGTGIEFGAVCDGDISVLYSSTNGQYFRTYIDGVDSGLFVTTNSGGIMTIAKDLPYGYHKVELYKSSETTAPVILENITINGTFCQKEADRPLIEIIGDSITCGNQNVIKISDGSFTLNDYDGKISDVRACFTKKSDATKTYRDIDLCRNLTTATPTYTSTGGTESFSTSIYNGTREFFDKKGNSIHSVPLSAGSPVLSYTTDGTRAYSFLTPSKLDCDWNIFAKSGATITEMYQRYKKQYLLDESKVYSPSRKTDIVVINMFTNGDWPNCMPDMENFVKLLRSYNDKVKIVFAYGAMTPAEFGHTASMKKVADYAETLNTNYENIWCFKFNLYRDAGGGHPSVANHSCMADELSEFLQDNVI